MDKKRRTTNSGGRVRACFAKFCLQRTADRPRVSLAKIGVLTCAKACEFECEVEQHTASFGPWPHHRGVQYKEGGFRGRCGIFHLGLCLAIVPVSAGSKRALDDRVLTSSDAVGGKYSARVSGGRRWIEFRWRSIYRKSLANTQIEGGVERPQLRCNSKMRRQRAEPAILADVTCLWRD